MQRIGIIGLGNMGMGMAKNLIEKGYELTAYDIRQEALNEIVQRGAYAAKTPQEVGENSDVAFVMVLNGAQVEEVVLGKQGLLSGMQPGSTIICTATTSAASCANVWRRLGRAPKPPASSPRRSSWTTHPTMDPPNS